MASEPMGSFALAALTVARRAAKKILSPAAHHWIRMVEITKIAHPATTITILVVAHMRCL